MPPFSLPLPQSVIRLYPGYIFSKLNLYFTFYLHVITTDLVFTCKLNWRKPYAIKRDELFPHSSSPSSRVMAEFPLIEP